MKNLSNVSLVCVEGLSDINVIEQAIKVIEHSSKVIRFGKKILITPKLEDNILSKLSNLGIVHYEINPLTWVGYNNFILLELVNYIDTDFCLTVQRDGFVLNPNLWDDDFLNYDYIGASWDEGLIHGSFWVSDEPKKSKEYSLVGNGGFSLRSKKLLNVSSDSKYVCLQVHPDKKRFQHTLNDGYITLGPEDTYICINNYKYFIDNGIKFAPIHMADKFSKEGNNKISWDSVFGFHGEKNFINNI